MPFKQSFTDPETGAIYPDAYWYPDSFALSVTGKSLFINYVAVVNQASLLQKKPLDRASHSYPFTDARFSELLSMLAQAPTSPEPFAVQLANLMDDLALGYEDTRKADDEGFESFFANAERIAPDLSVLG